MEPFDEEVTESKIVRLFPPSTESSDRRKPAPEVDAEMDERAAISAAVQGILEQAEPGQSLAQIAEFVGPDPTHRNAMRCPQCDQYTWRQTQHCLHCGADLVAQVARTAALHREQRAGILWSCAIASWAAALICVYVTQHYTLPLKIYSGLRYAGLGIIGANLIGFWIASMGKRP